MMTGSACSFVSDRKTESALWLLCTALAPPDTKITDTLQYPISVVAWNRISEITAGVEKRQSSSEPLPIISPVWLVWSPRWLSNWQYSPTNSCYTKHCKVNIYLASSSIPLDGQDSLQKLCSLWIPWRGRIKVSCLGKEYNMAGQILVRV